MPLHVQGQVVGPREGPLTSLAVEGFVAGVLAVVPRELVRPREPPQAPRPRARAFLLKAGGFSFSRKFRWNNTEILFFVHN